MRELKFENIEVGINASLKIHAFGYGETCARGSGWHLHPEYEIVYVRNGSGLLKIDTTRMPYKDGALLFIGPDIPHYDFGNNDCTDALEVVIQFPEAFVDQKLAAWPEFNRLRQFCDRSKRGLIFSAQAHQEIGPDLERLHGLKTDEKLLLFLHCLQRLSNYQDTQELFPGPTLPTITKPQDAQRLEKVFDRINRDYARPLSSSQLAEDLGMTTNSFCRFFKSNTQKTFLRFLNDYRLERAKDLLRNTDEDIKEIMYDCGFRDPAYFSKAFRKSVGSSPSRYRQQNSALKTETL